MMKELGSKLKKEDIKELQKMLPKLPKTKKTYLFVCMECGNEWESIKKINYLFDTCPKCHCGNIYCEEDE